MKTETWFYGESGGEVHGPLSIDTIRAAVAAGRLSDAVRVSRDSSGPWAPLRVVEKLGDAAFSAGGKKRERLAGEARAKDSVKRAHSEKSVAGFIEVIGYLCLAAGLVCLLAYLVKMADGDVRFFSYGMIAISNLVSGLMFLGVAEVLRKLGKIVAAAERIADAG